MASSMNLSGFFLAPIGQFGPPRAVDWDHYEVALSPDECRPKATLPDVPRPEPKALAGRGARLMARLLDALVLVVFIMTARILAEAFPKYPATQTALEILGYLVPAVCQWTLLAVRGQTLGKIAMGIRVVRADDDSNPGLGHAVVLRELIPGLISSIPLLGVIFAVIDVLCIFGDQRRCLHDCLADTKVIEA
jgi:uncharacterized RDD family membrane protein YckC